LPPSYKKRDVSREVQMTTDHIKMLQATVDKSRATIHNDGTISIGKPVSDGENDDFVEEIKEALEQPTNMVTIPLDKLEDMQRRLKPKEWQGLSDDEIVTKWIEHFVGNTFKGIEFARAVEAKLKEKNNG